jgi:hypothetical protein
LAQNRQESASETEERYLFVAPTYWNRHRAKKLLWYHFDSAHSNSHLALGFAASR